MWILQCILRIYGKSTAHLQFVFGQIDTAPRLARYLSNNVNHLTTKNEGLKIYLDLRRGDQIGCNVMLDLPTSAITHRVNCRHHVSLLWMTRPEDQTCGDSTPYNGRVTPVELWKTIIFIPGHPTHSS